MCKHKGRVKCLEMKVKGNDKQFRFTLLTWITSRSVPLAETRNQRILSN